MTEQKVEQMSSTDTAGWSLFLDRDGVINKEIPGTYVTNWQEFHFTENALSALKTAAGRYSNIVIATNQRGVGRGIMSFGDLNEIHSLMLAEINACGGRIDRVYACTALEDADHNRKPNGGMALQAQEDFPEIDFRKSVMVGNSLSDMEFGKRLGMYTVFITSKHQPFDLPHDLIDEQHASLADWAEQKQPEAVH